MKALICKNCGGSDLRPFPGHPDIVKCSYCGTTYRLDSSGNISKPQAPDYKVAIIVFSIFLIISIVLILTFKGSEPISSKYGPSEMIPQSTIERSSSSEIKTIQTEEIHGEILELHEVVSKYSDTIYYIGRYKNTGNTKIDKPKVQITFLSEEGEVLDTANGYGYNYLEPGEITGFQVMAKKSLRTKNKEIEDFPSKANYFPEQPKLKLSGLKIVKGHYSQYSVLGTIENESDYAAKHVSVNVILYDSEKKAQGMNFTYINQKHFKPKTKSVFKVDFYVVEKEPKDFWIEANGRKDE